jgi:hypothetical protein
MTMHSYDPRDEEVPEISVPGEGFTAIVGKNARIIGDGFEVVVNNGVVVNIGFAKKSSGAGSKKKHTGIGSCLPPEQRD